MKVDSSASPPSSSDPQQRKRRRMQSNRESARRSRMRKQKHLDDLTGEMAQLSKENNQISNSINVTTQHCVKMEASNSVLRAQMMELSQRLHSLNQILTLTHTTAAAVFEPADDDLLLNNSWNLVGATQQQPIMAAAHMFDYY